MIVSPTFAEPVRSLELADIGQLQQMELDDFAIDFSGIDVPKGILSADEIDRLSSVFASMVASEDGRAEARDMGA